MDADVLSLSSSSSSSAAESAAAEKQKDFSVKSDSSLPQSHQGNKSTEELWTDSPGGDRLLSVEEQVTLITESMTVTSTDQEKLLLLDKNAELRRVNKELMKLNGDWDQVYRNAMQGLQHRLECLELENATIKQLNSRLLLKVEHQQSAKEYYEQTLMQELKKNQELQECIMLLEGRMHQSDRDCTPAKQGNVSGVLRESASRPANHFSNSPKLPPGHISGFRSSSSFFPAPSDPEAQLQGQSQSSRTPLGELRGSQLEMQDLKEQLEALRCQTEIYEAEYQTEHNNHKHTQQENRRLRRKRDEMRQQVALLQEQLKVYEDDFRRERSDKQILQRLLLKKTPPNKNPVLVHRCNNKMQPLGGDKWTQSEERVHPEIKQHPLCPQHPNKAQESENKDHAHISREF